MEKILFLSERRFIDKNSQEGGVKFCTDDFIRLFKEAFDISFFPAQYKKDIGFRLLFKLGLDCYDYFDSKSIGREIKKRQSKEGFKYVALNTSQALRVCKAIKESCGHEIKTILLSHGNETGDYLHQFTRFSASQPHIQRLTSTFKIGRLLKTEALYRKEYVDLVCSVSPVENEIEKWLNAKNTFFVPRTVSPQFLNHKPILGRVGFMGDLSHWPNYFAVEQICHQLQKEKLPIEFRLVGGPNKHGEKLKSQFPFIHYLGFMLEEHLQQEIATWSLFLNLAFYYSKGVSTKLGKVMSYGIPILTTTPGKRGYAWKNGNLLVGDSPEEIVEVIRQKAFYMQEIIQARIDTREAASSTASYREIMNMLLPIIKNL